MVKRSEFSGRALAEAGVIVGLAAALYLISFARLPYGGKVSLESEVGCGSTFTVLLPVADGDLLAVPDGLC